MRVGLPTEGLTGDQVRQLEGFAKFLRAQNGAAGRRGAAARSAEEAAEPLRYAAYGGAKLSREQQARVREQARLAREEAERSGKPVVFLDDPDEQRR